MKRLAIPLVILAVLGLGLWMCSAHSRAHPPWSPRLPSHRPQVAMNTVELHA
jgi:hypothetical protein